MASFAKVIIIGNLGRDPEMRYTPNGRPVTDFSVAVSHRSRDAQTGEWGDDGTDWYRVSVWGQPAERAAEQLRKGNRVFVEGRFRTREFEGKDGQKRISLDVTADSVVSLEGRDRSGGTEGEGSFSAPSGGTGSSGGPAVRPTRPKAGDPDDLDDLPF